MAASNSVPKTLDDLIHIVKAKIDVGASAAPVPEDAVAVDIAADEDATDVNAEAAAMELGEAVATGGGSSGEKKTPYSVLLYILKKYRFWPALQVKHFFANKNLILLHNTYKRMDVSYFQNLYDECRSIVLDFSAPDGKNVVVSYAHPIPERINDEQYLLKMKDTDECEVSYEGTVVTVYNYQNRWFFGTSSCPTIDSSRYFHPTKTHGAMLDDVLANIVGENVPTNKEESMALRQAFAEKCLDTAKAYAFVLVHHQNSHIMDYTSTMGENYARLVHIVTRSRGDGDAADGHFSDEDLSAQPFASYGIIYPLKLAKPSFALDHLRNAPNVYGILCRTEEGKTYKVSIDEIVKKEERNIGNPNPWYNMIHVYIQNKQHYKISDYLTEFKVKLELPKSSRGIELDPTYIIHTSIVTMRDLLYKIYLNTTTFDVETKRYTINKEEDAKMAPIIRFHLVQLRNIQITRHKFAVLSEKAIYHYLCHHQTIKNLRLLIKFFATVWIDGHNLNGVPYKASECLVELNHALDDRV